MASEKFYTPKEAALEVLKKAHETLQKNETLAKKYEGFKAVEASAAKSGASDPGAVAAAIGRKKYGKEAFQHAAAEGKKMGKDEMGSAHAPVASGATINSQIGSPFGKNEDGKKRPYGPKEGQPEKTDKAYEPKKDGKPIEERIHGQPNPGENPKEEAEGNNPLAGTTPTQVGKDGKNIPGGDEIRGYLKLAKFCGRMEAKRQMKSGTASK